MLQRRRIQSPIFLEDIGLPLPITLSALVVTVDGSMNFCSICVSSCSIRLKLPHIFSFSPLGKGRDPQSIAYQQGIDLLLDPTNDPEVLVKDLPDPSEDDRMGDDDLWFGFFGYRSYLCDGIIEELVTGLAFVTLQGIDPQSEIVWRRY